MEYDKDTKTQPILPPPVHSYTPKGGSKSTRRINKLVVGALILIALGLLIIFAWGLESDEVLDIKESPFPTRTIRDHPTEGGVVFLTADYCKKKDITGELRISFVSQTREIFLPVRAERGEATCQNIELPVAIPQDIPPDEYVVKLRVTYDINPLKQNITNTYESEPFIIDPSTSENKLPEDSNLQGRPSSP